MKKAIYLFILFLNIQNIESQTILNPGDIMFVNINSTSPDNFDFVLLVDVEAGTIIKFTDNAWTGGDSLRTNEGILTWTSSSSITKGTIISYSGLVNSEWETSGQFAISNNGETILAFQGSTTNPSFIFGIGWGKANNWHYSGTNNDSEIPNSLSIPNHTIVQLGVDNNYKYSGISFGSKQQLLALTSVKQNWTSNDEIAFPSTTNSFNISTQNVCIPPYYAYVSEKHHSSLKVEWLSFGDEEKWNIEYGLMGHLFGTGDFDTTSATTYILTNLNPNTNYSFYIQSNCLNDTSFWLGPIVVQTTCIPSQIPYFENFDTEISPDLPTCTSEFNSNNDNQKWETYSSPGLYRSSPNSLKIKYNQYLAMDDWFFINGLELESNKIYRLEFYYRANGMSVLPEKLEVKIGNSPNVSTMSNNTIFINPYITFDNFELAYSNFTIPNTGVYYIGFHGFSDIDMDHLIIDDIKVSEVVNPSSETSIIYFNIPSQISSIIDTNNSTINIIMPSGTDKSALTPSIIVSSGATIFPQSGVPQNFSNQLNYTVTAENATSNRQWFVIVTNDTLNNNCEPPSNLSINAVSGENAHLEWIVTGDETSWNIRYKKTSDPLYDYISSVATNSHTINNLSLNSSYVCNVQAICNTNNLSNWSSEITFNTTTSIENILQDVSNTVYYANNCLFINNYRRDLINEISIYNLAGQKIYSSRPNKADDIVIPIKLISANYIVKIITKDNVNTCKFSNFN